MAYTIVMRARNAISISVLCLATSVAHADVTSYDLFKVQSYLQTGGSPIFNSAFASERVVTQNNGDISDANASRPQGTIDTLNLSADGVTWQYNSNSYSSTAAMLADFPLDDNVNNNAYGFYTDGFINSAVLFDQYNLFGTAAPIISTTNLQNLTAGHSAAVSWTTFTKNSNATEGDIFVDLYDLGTGTDVYSNSGNTSYTSDTLPSTALLSGHTYGLVVDFANRAVSVPNNGFGSAAAIDSYDIRTEADFTVQAVPAPSGVLIFGLGLVGLAILRRKA